MTPDEPVTFDKLYGIEGTMVHGFITIPNNTYLAEAIDEEEKKRYIKRNLATLLAQEIIDKGLVEFTKSEDPILGTKISCRMFLTPTRSIQILRTSKIK